MSFHNSILNQLHQVYGKMLKQTKQNTCFQQMVSLIYDVHWCQRGEWEVKWQSWGGRTILINLKKIVCAPLCTLGKGELAHLWEWWHWVT